MITVHAKAPEDWLLPCLWAWSAPDGTNAFANWPGEELTLEGDWYVKDVPNWINSVILNGNLGAVQTVDISVESGKDIWLVVKGTDEYELFYEEPDLGDPIEEVSTEQEVTKEVSDTVVAEPEPEKKAPVGLIAGIVGGVIVVGGAITAIVLKKKKAN